MEPIISIDGERHLTFIVTLERDGVWIVECPAIPGCVSQGDSEKEAIENIKDAISA